MATPFLQNLTKAIDMMEHDLEEDARGLTEKVVSVKERGKVAIQKGHTKVDSTAGRVADVEKFVTALEGSNGGDPLDDSQNSSENSQKQLETTSESEVGNVEDVIAEVGSPVGGSSG